MVSFKEDSVVIIAPGSRVTRAQLGIPDAYTPPKVTIPSRMFPTADKNKWEPVKIRQRKPGASTNTSTANGSATNGAAANGDVEMTDATAAAAPEEPIWEEDPHSDESAVYPIINEKIVDWKAYFALLTHVHGLLNTPFNAPIILVIHTSMNPKDIDKITEFVFNKFQPPAFSIVDAASCGLFAFNAQTSLIVDVGYKQTRLVPIVDWVTDRAAIANVKDAGGLQVTKALFRKLEPKGWTLEMCEKLKRSPICEILPVGSEYPGSVETLPVPKDGAPQEPSAAQEPIEPVMVADQPIESSAPGPSEPAPLPETEDGVLDIASLLVSGKEKEFIAQADKQKADKAAEKANKASEKADKAAKKAAADAAAKAERVPNSKRPTNTFTLEERRTISAEDEASRLAEEKREATPEPISAVDGAADDNTTAASKATRREERRKVKAASSGVVKREMVVGYERFCGNEGKVIENIGEMVYATIQNSTNPAKRADLWDNLIIIGHGASVRGFKEALLGFLTARYLVSPSSDTMFTSELPSNLSTPLGTGANTPQPPLPGSSTPLGGAGSGVNPLLLAATTASHAAAAANTTGGTSSGASAHAHQTPTSIKHAKGPDYFSEWKDVGMDGCEFLGAQVIARLAFFLDAAAPYKHYMTRSEWNEFGPGHIHESRVGSN